MNGCERERRIEAKDEVAQELDVAIQEIEETKKDFKCRKLVSVRRRLEKCARKLREEAE